MAWVTSRVVAPAYPSSDAVYSSFHALTLRKYFQEAPDHDDENASGVEDAILDRMAVISLNHLPSGRTAVILFNRCADAGFTQQAEELPRMSSGARYWNGSDWR